MQFLLTLFLVLAQASPEAPADPQPAAAPNAPAAPEPPAAQAAPEPPAAPPSPEPGSLEKILNSGALGYMWRGGIFMWPILLLGIIALGVIIERWRSLKMLRTDANALRTQVRDLLNEDRVEEALALCERSQGPVPAVVGTGLRKFLVLRRLGYDPGRIEEQVVKSMDDYGVHIVAALEKHLPILATVSSAAPMIGFLGTVQGMVLSFDEINARLGQDNIVKLAAGGIGVALLTTCLGLIVGIPAYIAFNYFNGVINRFVLEVEESATELIEAVTLQLALERHNGQPLPASGNSHPAEVGAAT